MRQGKGEHRGSDEGVESKRWKEERRVMERKGKYVRNYKVVRREKGIEKRGQERHGREWKGKKGREW